MVPQNIGRALYTKFTELTVSTRPLTFDAKIKSYSNDTLLRILANRKRETIHYFNNVGIDL
ncbi:hypothetical protein Mapa_005374 [Marchantia paleacea]|nr:hypothetical protein Mapa_005374 [Marchantia paleacea]